MINDRELVRQMLQRDVYNLYRNLPATAQKFGFSISPLLGMFEDKILTYADLGVDMAVDWLFGEDVKSDIDEVSEIAKLIANDKIDEYREKVRNAKNEKL